MNTQSPNINFITQRKNIRKTKFHGDDDDDEDNEVILNLKETPKKKCLITSPTIDSFTNDVQDLNLYTPIESCKKSGVVKSGEVSPFRVSFEDSDDAQYAPTQLLSPVMPLKDCMIFVDVRAENENRSKAISRELEKLGATIADKVTNTVSHVVFKDGKNATLNQLKKFPNIHVVSVLWVDSCKTTSSRINESLFPAKLPGTVDSPLPIFARSRRVKSLQPKTFEEDLNNSAKKEDRRKRRLKKQNKTPNTPIDQIICLDSQEYIKSSDLYKLVATPRAIPDTPWIVKYINGDEEVDTPSELHEAGVNNTTEHDNEELQKLSQDIQCRLNFDLDVDKENKKSCLTNVGSSPSEKQTVLLNDNDAFIPNSPKKPKVAFSKRTSICRQSVSSSSFVSKDLTKQAGTLSTKSINSAINHPTSISMKTNPLNNVVKTQVNKPTKKSNVRFTELEAEKSALENVDKPTSVKKLCKVKTLSGSTERRSNRLSASCTKIHKNHISQMQLSDGDDNLITPRDQDTKTEKQKRLASCNETSSNKDLEKHSEELDFTKTNACNDVEIEVNVIPKKKKRLMSKSRFKFPQEKLISPATKSDQKVNNKENCKNVMSSKSKTERLGTSKTKIFDAYTAINAVTHSRKDSTKSKEKSISPPKEKTEVSETLHQHDASFVSIAYNQTLNNIQESSESVIKPTIVSKNKIDQINDIASGSIVTNCFHNPPKDYNLFHEQLVADAVESELKQTDSDCITTKSETKKRRQSPRLSASRRSSGIDFKVSKSYRKVDTCKNTSKLSTKKNIKKEPLDFSWSTINNEQDAEENIKDKDEINEKLDVSFIHDEEQGLICLSNANREAYYSTQKERTSDETTTGNELPLQQEKRRESQSRNEANTFKLDVTNQENPILNESDHELNVRNVVLNPPDEDDSGISDSEELNINQPPEVEIDIDQPPEDYSCIETVETSTNTEDNLACKNSHLESKAGKYDLPLSPQPECSKQDTKERTSLKENTVLKKKPVYRTKKELRMPPSKKVNKPKVSLVTTSLHFGELEYVRVMSKEIGGFIVRKNVTADTTHIVAGGPRRTLNILHGIIKGCWILNTKWVADSSEKGEWLNEENYEMNEEFPMAKVSRLNRTRENKYNHAKLFAKLSPVYLAEVTSPTHEEMMRLITACGGQLTTSLRKAGVGIGLITCRRKDLRIVSEKWILDSITNGRIMPTESYEIKMNRNREQSPGY